MSSRFCYSYIYLFISQILLRVMFYNERLYRYTSVADNIVTNILYTMPCLYSGIVLHTLTVLCSILSPYCTLFFTVYFLSTIWVLPLNLLYFYTIDVLSLLFSLSVCANLWIFYGFCCRTSIKTPSSRTSAFSVSYFFSFFSVFLFFYPLLSFCLSSLSFHVWEERRYFYVGFFLRRLFTSCLHSLRITLTP